jgi:hypothetical protein
MHIPQVGTVFFCVFSKGIELHCAYLANMRSANLLEALKGLSHEIFGPVFWAAWMYLDLNVNRLWFLNFDDAPLILDNYFKF